MPFGGCRSLLSGKITGSLHQTYVINAVRVRERMQYARRWLLGMVILELTKIPIRYLFARPLLYLSERKTSV